HLFGKNSFAENDNLHTGEGTGLEQDQSDYVASAYVKVSRELAFSSRFRFAEEDLEVRAAELEAKFQQGPVLAGLTYGSYEAQPQLGLERTAGIVGSTKIDLSENFYVLGAARYDIETDKFDRAQVGAGYLDECFSFGLNY